MLIANCNTGAMNVTTISDFVDSLINGQFIPFDLIDQYMKLPTDYIPIGW